MACATEGVEVCTAGGISRSRPRSFIKIAFAFALALASTFALAARHPANIPSARVHVTEDRTVELHVRFDILAFCLEFTPQEIADAPMNALLDGPSSELTNRLADAKNRFLADTKVITDSGMPTFQSITFPSITDVQKCAQENGTQRLPVMLAAVIKEKLPANAKTIACQFPSVMGSVVVTTELPYQEPLSEPVDAGASSTPLSLPDPKAAASSTPGKAAIGGSSGWRLEAKTASKHETRDDDNAATSTPPGNGSIGNVSDSRAAKKPAKNKTEGAYNAPAANTRGNSVVVSSSYRRLDAKESAKGEIKEPDSGGALSTTSSAERNNSNYPSGGPSWPVLFVRYVRMGFQHIIPQGLDHILFVLGLFLLSRKTKPLLTQISAFTIAHSITLGLSLYGVFSLPSKIVEPLIAASIVFVAVENLFTTEMKAWRPFVVFGFGLVHGLGFASALRETGLAHGSFLTGLVGFNAGVELGQLTVVAIVFAAVGWFRTKPSYRYAVVMPASIAIALIAAFWTIQRLAI